MVKMDVIKFNDDNHAERMWINGRYVGDASNLSEIVCNAVKLFNNVKVEQFSETDVWIYDFEEIESFTEEDIEILSDWFSSITSMAFGQIEFIKAKNFELLLKTIK